MRAYRSVEVHFKLLVSLQVCLPPRLVAKAFYEGRPCFPLASCGGPL